MKNLIKLLAIIALITIETSNVCGQIQIISQDITISKDTTYVISYTVTENYISNAKIKLSFESDVSASNIVFIKNNTVIIDTNISKTASSFEHNIGSVAIGDNIKVKFTPLDKNLTLYRTNTNFTGLSNNLLSNDVNLYSYNNTIVLENKVAPKKLIVNVYNLSGQLVLTESIEGLNTRNEFNTNLPDSIYVVHVSDGVNQITKKLSINKGR